MGLVYSKNKMLLVLVFPIGNSLFLREKEGKEGTRKMDKRPEKNEMEREFENGW